MGVVKCCTRFYESSKRSRPTPSNKPEVTSGECRDNFLMKVRGVLGKLVVFGLAVFFVSSCGPKPKQGYMPLKKGNAWTYTVRTGLQTTVQVLKVEKPIAVNSVQGWILNGPMGESRVAWKSGILLAEQLPGTVFSPALPLLDAKKLDSTRRWHGTVLSMGRPLECTAEIVQGPDQYVISGHSFSVLKVVVNLHVPQKSIELVTWFAEGIGILSQQQRSQGYLECALEYLSGP